MDDKAKAIMKTLNLLYVEDEQATRDMFLDSFNRKFGKVIVAENGAEGVQKYQECQPDVIVTDLQMPVMDGLTMIETIRSMDPDIPIIVITAYSDLDNLRKAIEMDVDRFIQKPPNKGSLDKALVKATLSIVKQKEIEDRDRIIKTVLGWDPYFSVICNAENIEHVTSDFLGYLGYKNRPDLFEKMESLVWFDMENSPLKLTSISDLLNYLDKDTDNRCFVDIPPGEKSEKETFEVRGLYYQQSGLYLLSFFKHNPS